VLSILAMIHLAGVIQVFSFRYHARVTHLTHLAPVNKIVPWKDTGKYCLEFAEPAQEIGPIKLDQPGRGMAPQGPRYTSFKKFSQAKVWTDVF